MPDLLHPRVDVLSDEAYGLGEGARVVDGGLVHVDILAGRLLAHPGTRGGTTTELLRLDVPLGAVAPVGADPAHDGGASTAVAGAGRRWVAAAGEGIALVGPDAEPRWLARPESRHGGATRMNDGVCDAAGRFWAGSTAYDGESPLGALHRLDLDGSVTTVLTGLVDRQRPGGVGRTGATCSSRSPRPDASPATGWATTARSPTSRSSSGSTPTRARPTG